MKVIITTSDKYHHLLPVFFYLYNKYCGLPFDLVGHAKPECELPDNCTWVSLGPQGSKQDWSNQIRPYFKQQPEYFIWMMEDTFLKAQMKHVLRLPCTKVGRIDLTGDVQKRKHFIDDDGIVYADAESRYRLSTQPSIWGKDFLLQYLTPNLSPWDFETRDPKNDGWSVLGFKEYPVNHNEGVRRFDLYKLNLDGMCQEDINHINSIALWQTK